jgi:hypothetical protein
MDEPPTQKREILRLRAVPLAAGQAQYLVSARWWSLFSECLLHSISLPPSLPPSPSLLYARGFANQVASLQDVAAVEERQTLHFAFAGADGVMQKDEFRRRENFAKFMSRVLIGAKC